MHIGKEIVCFFKFTKKKLWIFDYLEIIYLKPQQKYKFSLPLSHTHSPPNAYNSYIHFIYTFFCELLKIIFEIVLLNCYLCFIFIFKLYGV